MAPCSPRTVTRVTCWRSAAAGTTTYPVPAERSVCHRIIEPVTLLRYNVCQKILYLYNALKKLGQIYQK